MGAKFGRGGVLGGTSCIDSYKSLWDFVRVAVGTYGIIHAEFLFFMHNYSDIFFFIGRLLYN